MNGLSKILLLFACSTILYSCRKVVDLDLNDADPRIVIEATISDLSGPHLVKLTRTVNFDQSNVFPAVTGAIIRLSDDAGNTEVLTETEPGIYQTSTFKGVPGRSYTLNITDGDKTYTAVSKMPQPVSIDSLNIQKGLFREAKNVHVFFTDPKGIQNWYRIIEVIDAAPTGNLHITEDILRDGNHIDAMLFTPEEDSLVINDSVTVFLQSIDEGAYEYFRTLSQLRQGGGQSASPSNPKSNFNNGALGYFSAYAETRKAIVVR